MSVGVARQSEQAVTNALKQNPQFLQVAFDLYKNIVGDIRDYIHGPLNAQEFTKRMNGYGKAIGQWRNIIATVQLAGQIKNIDELVRDIPRLDK